MAIVGWQRNRERMDGVVSCSSAALTTDFLRAWSQRLNWEKPTGVEKRGQQKLG